MKSSSAMQRNRRANRKSAISVTLLWFALLLATAAVFIVPVYVAAQTASASNNAKVRYKLIDLGTLGGPVSYGSMNGDGFRLLNDSGAVASYADLAVPDP